MAHIKIEKFAGRMPRRANRLLAPEQAACAVNCKLWSGELRPFASPADILDLSGCSPRRSLTYLGRRFWLHFDRDIDAVRCPVAGEHYDRTCLTGLGAPLITDTRLSAAARLDGLMFGGRLLGVPAPDAAPVVRLNRPGTGAFESRAYVHTFVNEYGEEGPPSPPSRTLDATVDASVRLTGPAIPPGEVSGLDTAIVKRRIYRTETSAQGSAMYGLVAEIDARLTRFVDNKHTADLGETLRSRTWHPPPADMRGIVALPNGVMAGFRNNEICFSEPSAPHAWPPEYRLVTDHPVVAIGAYDTTIVVATTAYPYLVTGSVPAAMSMSRLPGRQACVSKRALVSSEAGVIYPTPDGLYLIGPKAGLLVTRDLFTRDEWQALDPSSMHAVVHDGRMFVFYGDGGKGSGGLILDRAEPDAGLTNLDYYAYAAYSDSENDRLYLILDDGAGPRIVQWEGGDDRATFEWRSKTFVTRKPRNFAVGRILADFPQRLDQTEQAALEQSRLDKIAANRSLIDNREDPDGSLNGQALATFAINGDELAVVPEPYREPSGLSFTLKGDGSVRRRRDVTADGLFRLPAGYTAREWEIGLSANFAVREVRLGASAEEIGEGS
jgi:hypothetical protein